MTEYHWSPSNQRAFLEELATTGNITAAAKTVGMSKQSAHAFCGRGSGAAFRLGWDAAVLLARRRVESELLERALEGQEETYERDAETGRVTRTRVHNGLSMAMLARLDRMALGRNDVAAETTMARIVAQDFDAYLDLIEAGGTGAAAMLFVAARDGGLYSLSGRTIEASDDGTENFATHGQLAQISAASDDTGEEEVASETNPDEQAAEMSVWYCEYAQGWRTNFPPPPDFDGGEEGEFGDDSYERDLSEEEAEARAEQAAAEVAPLREAGEAARRAWFGLGQSAKPSTPSLCHPRERGERSDREVNPRPDCGVNHDPCVVPEAQALDPRVHGDDKAESDGVAEATASASTGEIEYKSNASIVRPPPEDPNIRVIHCKPRINWVARGVMPPHIATEFGITLPRGDPRLEYD